MTRIYCPEAGWKKRIKLSKEQKKHLKVLRKGKSEEIKLFDGKGGEWKAVLEGDWARITKTTKKEQQEQEITVATSIPKGNRMDFLVEKISELGAKKLIPMICKRAVVKPKERKIQRWERISIEASSQSGRCHLTEISKPEEFDSVIKTAKNYDQAILCRKEGKDGIEKAKKTLILIGPEGGFTEEETKQARLAGFKEVKLSENTLRVETAAIAAVQLATKAL